MSARPPLGPARAAWHVLDVAQTAARLDTDPRTGLAPEEGQARLARHGPNVVEEAPPRSAWRLLAGQLADFMIAVLMGAAILSAFIGEAADTIAILAIVVLNAAIGFAQEWRAQRALMALRQMAAPHATVVRGGERLVVGAAELVPGDLVVLEAGALVPADVRLVEARQLKVDESLLTGESVPVEKTTAPLAEVTLGVADRVNLAFKGTTVTYGRGTALVVGTGMDTEFGRVAAMLATEQSPDTPLQRRLASLGRRLAVAVLVICAAVFGLGLARGEPWLPILLTAVSLAVAAIPEALPAVVSLVLALGARRMAEAHALVRRLPAVETLGSVTVICADKTGTLTQNRMRVERVWAAGEERPDFRTQAGVQPWESVLAAMALSNDAIAAREGAFLGDPTEVALLRAAGDAGRAKAELEAQAPRVLEIPFSAERKRMTTVHRTGGGFLAYTKGAPETVLPRCTRELDAGGERAIDAARVEQAAERMGREGLRVLALARREWARLPDDGEPDEVERELTLLGLAGLLDPPRPEAAPAVATCLSAGIRPIMITGDQALTASAIAARVGLADEGARVIDGIELGRMSEEALSEALGTARVFARTDPGQKIRIVKALQARGDIAAMTGDGVNDAPALQRADIGVAMGSSGTDVAREAAGLVLLDDNFATVVAAVREGRRVYDNVRKFIRYVLTGNAAEILVVAVAPLLGLPLALLPIHILWVNLVTDGLPGLALAVEPAERGIMARAPRPPAESLFARGMWQHIVWVGGSMSAMVLGVHAWLLGVGDVELARTGAFTALTVAQMAHVVVIRGERASLLATGLTTNLPLLGAVLLTFGLQLAILYVPALNGVFRTVPLPPIALAACVGVGVAVGLLVEAEKWAIRRYDLYPSRPSPVS